MEIDNECDWSEACNALLQGKLVGRVFEWLLPQPVDDCLRVLSSCLLGGKNVTPLMCSTTETIGSSNADDGEDTVSYRQLLPSKASVLNFLKPRYSHGHWIAYVTYFELSACKHLRSGQDIQGS